MTAEAPEISCPICRQVIEPYRDAIDALSGKIKVEDALFTLLTRDRVAAFFEGERGLTPEARRDLEAALKIQDRRLRRLGGSMVARVGADAFSRWRGRFRPPAAAWWWFFDQAVSETEAKWNACWLAPTGLVLAVSLANATDISTRFLSGGPDSQGLLLIAAQVFFTFVAGSVFTEAGRRWLADIFSVLALPRRRQPLFSLFLALLLLGSTVWLRSGLPSIARSYHEAGNQLLTVNLSDAIEKYRRAIALSPDDAVAHYDLAAAWEQVLDYEKAIAEYQRAIEINGQYDHAYNNLARLYILKSSDYSRALEVISKVFAGDETLEGKDSSIRYAAYKNRGWAFWGLKRKGFAEADLLEALNAYDGAEANALLARLLDEQGRKKDAAACWRKAVKPDPGDVIDANLFWMAAEQNAALARGDQAP